MGPRRGAVDAGVASFSKVIRTSGTRSVQVVGCTRCFPTRPASVPKLDSEGPQRYRCRECGCRSVSKLAGVTRLLSDFLIPHFKLSHYLPAGLGSAFWQSPNEAWASVRCASNPWARSVELASRPFDRGTARVRPQSYYVFKRSTALRLRFRCRTGSESHPRLDQAAPDCLRYACYPRQAAGKPPRLIWSTALPATSVTGSPVWMNQESQLAFQSGITSGLSPNSVRRT